MIKDYKDLIMWQKSMTLAEEAYAIVKLLPKEETYALSDQMRRAEGYQRKSDGYIKNFLNMARGSNAELETQLLLCIRLGYISKTEAQKALQLTEELSKMLSGFINKLSNAVR